MTNNDAKRDNCYAELQENILGIYLANVCGVHGPHYCDTRSMQNPTANFAVLLL